MLVHHKESAMNEGTFYESHFTLRNLKAIELSLWSIRNFDGTFHKNTSRPEHLEAIYLDSWIVCHY